MTATGWGLVLVTALLTVCANLLIRVGLERAGGFHVRLGALTVGLFGLARQPAFDLGLVLYAVASVVWFRIVSTEPLSLAYPMLVSVTFFLVTIGASIFLREPMTWSRVVGLAVILAGIAIAGGRVSR